MSDIPEAPIQVPSLDEEFHYPPVRTKIVEIKWQGCIIFYQIK
jgi:hypothetical protein